MTKLVQDSVLIDGHRIACGVHGEGKPIILIHGTPFYSHIWRNILPTLLDAKRSVYLYDLYGFGHSERPHDKAADTSVSAQLPVLVGLMAHWGLVSCDIVGHDLGGAIAQQLGIYHPDKVESLTLIDTVSFDSWPSRRTKEQMSAGLEKLIGAPAEQHREHFREWILSASSNHENLLKGAIDAYLNMICGPVGQASLFQHQIMHYDPMHTAKLTDHLHELGQFPVQLIWGEDDAWQVKDWAHKLHVAIPNSNLNILPNCGHLAPEDQADKVAELIIAHLAAHNS